MLKDYLKVQRHFCSRCSNQEIRAGHVNITDASQFRRKFSDSSKQKKSRQPRHLIDIPEKGRRQRYHALKLPGSKQPHFEDFPIVANTKRHLQSTDL